MCGPLPSPHSLSLIYYTVERSLSESCLVFLNGGSRACYHPATSPDPHCCFCWPVGSIFTYYQLCWQGAESWLSLSFPFGCHGCSTSSVSAVGSVSPKSLSLPPPPRHISSWSQFSECWLGWERTTVGTNNISIWVWPFALCEHPLFEHPMLRHTEVLPHWRAGSDPAQPGWALRTLLTAWTPAASPGADPEERWSQKFLKAFSTLGANGPFTVKCRAVFRGHADPCL